jgi:hypothetical protein
MSDRNPMNSLDKLRADLRHFEECGDFGENPTLIEIKRRLLLRIAELESSQRRRAGSEAASTPGSPDIED